MYPKYTINAKNKAVLTILILMGTDSILYGILYQVMFVYLVCFSEPAGATQEGVTELNYPTCRYGEL